MGPNPDKTAAPMPAPIVVAKISVLLPTTMAEVWAAREIGVLLTVMAEPPGTRARCR